MEEIGGQKKPDFVNVVCERPLSVVYRWKRKWVKKILNEAISSFFRCFQPKKSDDDNFEYKPL